MCRKRTGMAPDLTVATSPVFTITQNRGRAALVMCLRRLPRPAVQHMTGTTTGILERARAALTGVALALLYKARQVDSHLQQTRSVSMRLARHAAPRQPPTKRDNRTSDKQASIVPQLDRHQETAPPSRHAAQAACPAENESVLCKNRFGGGDDGGTVCLCLVSAVLFGIGSDIVCRIVHFYFPLLASLPAPVRKLERVEGCLLLPLPPQHRPPRVRVVPYGCPLNSHSVRGRVGALPWGYIRAFTVRMQGAPVTPSAIPRSASKLKHTQGRTNAAA